MKKNIAIIPARGGSKRLPGKNMLPLNGLPLIYYSIAYAKANSDIIDTIIVSTDDETIKEFALKQGVEVLDRPEILSGDSVPTIDVLKHVLETVEASYDHVMLLQVTNPLRPKSLLSMAYKTFLEDDVDSLMTVTRNHQKFGKIVNDAFQPFNYTMGQRSQDLEPLYFENGLLYISKAALILDHILLGEKNYPYIVNHPFAHADIDTQDELDMAEYLIKKYSTEKYD